VSRRADIPGIAILALGMGAAAGVGLLERTSIDEARGDTQRAIAASPVRADGRAVSRRPAWGEPRDGSAFTAYARASTLLRDEPWPHWDEKTQAVRDQSLAWSAERLAAARARWAPAFAALEEGAHATDATPHSHQAILWIACKVLARTEVAVRLQEQRWLDAVRLWLDAATMLCDCDVPFGFVDDIWNPGVLAAASADARAELARGLERLEARLLAPIDGARQLAQEAQPLLDGTVTIWEWNWRDVLAAAPHDYDPRAQHLRGIAERLAQCEQHGPRAATGREREQEWAAWRALPTATSSRVADHALGVAANRDRAQRCEVARLRLLRLALAFVAHEPLPDLVDPWSGEPFAVTIARDGGTEVLHARGSEPRAGLERRATRR
jgi:hypothetical protein